MGIKIFFVLAFFTGQLFAAPPLHFVFDLDHTLWIPLDQMSVAPETLNQDQIFEANGKRVLLIPGAIELLSYIRNGLHAELSVQTFGSSVVAAALLKIIPTDESHSLFDVFRGQITKLRHDPLDPHRSEKKSFESAPVYGNQEVIAVDDTIDAWAHSDRHSVLEVPRDGSVLEGGSNDKILSAIQDGKKIIASRVFAAQNRLVFIAGLIAIAEKKALSEQKAISEVLFEIRFKLGPLNDYLKSSAPADLRMADEIFSDINVYRQGLSALRRYSPHSKTILNTVLGRRPKGRVGIEFRSTRAVKNIK